MDLTKKRVNKFEILSESFAVVHSGWLACFELLVRSLDEKQAAILSNSSSSGTYIYICIFELIRQLG